jgi:pyridoxamine 5'-phosphate oxidase
MRDVRRDYGKGSPIEVKDLANPLELLSRWMQDAIDGGVTEPNAMNIATVDSKGNPRNRMVLLKYLEGDDIGFFTNLKSDKSLEIRAHSMVSATIWWPEMERQVRIEGVATQMDRALAEDYHSSRPRKSRVAAWASDQSRPLGSREELEERFDQYDSMFYGEDVPLPPFWGGYTIRADKIEYWEGRPNRLHERIVVMRGEEGWEMTRLYP